MNKFILEITIYNNDKNELEIKFLRWDERFLYEATDLVNHPFCYYEADDGFSIFSNDVGYIFDGVLAVPSFSEIKKNNTLKESFKTDDKRLEYLKSLYKCLEEWSTNYGRFKGDTMINDKIIVNGKYWIK
jgi:hypothetical protein